MNEIEHAVWEALEPYLESHIHLDLNNLGDSTAFREMAQTVAKAATDVSVSDSDRQTLAITIDNIYDDYQPVYDADGKIVSSNIADAVAPIVVGVSAHEWENRARGAESALFRVFGYMRAAAGRVFERTGEVFEGPEYSAENRSFRLPYKVTFNGRDLKFRTLDEARIEASDVKSYYPDTWVSIYHRVQSGEWWLWETL